MKKQHIIKSIVVLIGFILMVFLGDIFKALDVSIPRISENNYLQVLFRRLIYYSPMIIAVSVAFPNKFFKILGLSHPPVRPFVYALVSCAPLFIIYPFFFNLKTTIEPFEIYNLSIISPAFEEICYRALFFGTLVGLLRWKFWYVVALNAAAFSFGHLYQASDMMSIILTVLVTSVACIWWGWMYIRWHYNLWFPLFLHITMNFSFELFQVSGGAAGGGIATYAGRLLVILISVFITLKYTKSMTPMEKDNSIDKRLSNSLATSD